MNSKSRKTRAAAGYDGGGRIVAAVNDDVLTEILIRLPAKYVTRLKLVCKRWLSLISCGEFRRLHTLRRCYKLQPSLLLSAPNSNFFYLNPIINGEKNLMMIPYSFPLPNPKILSSCNGLLLLQCDNPQTDYYVYNPTTKQSRKIVLTHNDKYIDLMGLILAFDPSKSPRYKIVCIRADAKRSYQIEVYDSESHSWNLCFDPLTTSSVMNFSSCVHCNNLIYGKTLYDSIYYYDIGKNVVRFLPRPRIPEADISIWSSQLQESNGYLYYIAMISKPAGVESVALWELQGDDHSRTWFLKYRGRINNLHYTRILRFNRGTDAGETSILLTCDHFGKIRVYSFLDKSYKELIDLTKLQTFYLEDVAKLCCRDVHHFGESLAMHELQAEDCFSVAKIVTWNDDVLIEILLRLPGKSVTRFKLVCRHWLSLISTDGFHCPHTLHRHKPEPSLILCTRTSQFFYLNPTINSENVMIPYTFTLPNPKILSSCNGLLLLQCVLPKLITTFTTPPPSNQEKIILNYDHNQPCITGLNLAFNFSKSPHYKIICVGASRNYPHALARSYQIEVYNSESRTWKLCLKPFTDSTELHFCSGVYLNNKIYWNNSGIFSHFDIDKMVLQPLPRPRIPWPEHWKTAFCFSQLQESDGQLYHSLIDYKGESVALWELQRDDHSQWWFLKYYDRIGHLLSTFGRICSCTPLRFISGSNGDETNSTLVTHVPGKIRAYRFLGKSSQELVDFTNQNFCRKDSLQFDCQDVHQFGESLAPV